jgi:ABC-type oligopeptide transport system substrate-binding subunit
VLPPPDAAKALVAGEVDVLPSLTAEQYEVLRSEKSVRVLEQPGEMLYVLVPKLDAPPWDSVERRRALLAALDREAMVKALEPAPASVASGWRKATASVVPEAAPLEAQVVKLFLAPIRSEGDTHALLARRVVADLAKVNVTVELVETPALYQAVQRGEFEGLALLGRDTSDFTRFLGVRDVSKAAGAHYDDEMVERVAAIQGTLYVERRRALEGELQEAWFKRLPVLPLVLTSRLAAVRADLEGPDWGVADSVWWNVAEWHVRAAEQP